MSSLLWLLLYFLISTCQCTWSMLIVWGGDVEGVPEDFSGSWDECIDYCLVEESCVVIRQPASFGCQIFRYGSISTVQSTGNTKIGFKRKMATCSLAMSSPPFFGDSTVTETYQAVTIAYQYRITLSEDTYMFNLNYYVQCQNDSFVSLQGSKPVCISVRVFPNTSFCQNRASGLELCQGNGGMGMTGPYSMDEGKVVTDAALTQMASTVYEELFVGLIPL
ncbi:hypothetical protein CAEBREN_17861 [Caenorhabditis brenneri]|uniref:PAN-3 domain-containing protein n=1 Tax=Caenorhabditis brenneri TaxID=135651 RepID=G0NCK0_CAEBE|nr:hypothetical protein CAEBREN_17861 [Caenorhabditis brenneri]